MRATLLLLALASLGAAQDYFPLQAGNQWVYRVSGRAAGDPLTVEVARTGEFSGQTYALVRGLAGDAWLRTASDGSLYAYDTASGTERLWTSFAGDFVSNVPPCTQPARVAEKPASYTGPIGEFDRMLEINYQPGSCRDAGIERDLYLPWIGLVQRRVTTIAGPRTYDLIYARLGGITVISGKETGFTLTLDQSVYRTPQMLARLTLRHTQDAPLRLTFNSGQRYDLVIKNEKGDVVYQWSRGKFFTLAIGTEIIGPGEKNWAIAAPLDDIPNGHYVAEAWLTSAGPRAYAASAGFDIER
ncbi:MAG: BsuPI-related putative proteinase inhibitor [Bryobacteraceae bacterium]